jgi:RNA polymerase sigma-70 factor, ECF subfamily
MLRQREELEKELHLGIRKGLEGDREAYEKFLLKVASIVRGYLFNNLSKANRTDERVEDLVQDVLLSIHRKKHLYRLDLPVIPWLFTIARYRLIDHWRAEMKRPPSVEWAEDFDPPAPADGSLSDSQLFELEELLEGLSSKQKQILILAKAEKIPLADIARQFDMSLSAVKVTVHRALRKVRSQAKARM